jgi:hypothetical protein
MLRLCTMLAATVLATGCATAPCPTDWAAIGQQDGIAGYEVGRFSAHARACSGQGAPTDEDAYRRGWATGNAAYCVRATGESQGAAGNGPAPACEGRGGYAAGWAAGIERHCTPERGQAAGAAGREPNPWCNGRNRDGYRAGHAWGLMSYCTSENGWQAGWKGSSARSLCRGVGDDAYLRGHRIGSAARDTQAQLDDLAREIRQIETDLSAASDTATRALLGYRLVEANRDQRQLREQLTRLRTAR